MTEGSYTSDQKKVLCERLSELPPSSHTKEIFALIQDYNRKMTLPLVKRLGNRTVTPFGAKKNGDDYTFDVNNLPDPLLQMIERLLDTE